MQRLYHYIILRLPLRHVRTDQRLDLLNPDEQAMIRRVRAWALFLAAGFDVIGYLIYYLPIYYLPWLFPKIGVELPLLGTHQLAWVEYLWAIVLTIAEIYALVLLNIVGAHAIGVATGFIRPETRLERLQTLIHFGTEYQPRKASHFGIDPYQGTNRWMLTLYLAAWRLKGWIGNKIIQYSLVNLLGRFALRELVDFAGMPLYMAINMWSTNAVLRETRIGIMGIGVVDRLRQRLPMQRLSGEVQALLYDALQLIAMSKRDYHPNHDLLTEMLMGFYAIPVESYHYLSANYLEVLTKRRDAAGKLCRLVLALGFVLDGRLSRRERRQIQKFNQMGVMDETYHDLKRYTKQFVNGQGLDALLDHYLGAVDQPQQPMPVADGSLQFAAPERSA